MASAWEELEDRCYEHLKRFCTNGCSIESLGKSDSTKADIKITTASKEEFFVEVKAENAQCCQFVLFPDDKAKKFVFSKQNKVPLTDNCKKIIEYMDARYATYCRVGKAGIAVNVDKATLYGLVNDFYSAKNVKFFMTEGAGLIIFPAEKFAEYFDIEAVYRRKTSGSAEPNDTGNRSEIIQGLLDEGISGILEYKSSDGKTRCYLHADVQLHKQRMLCPEYTYQFKDNSHAKKVKKQKEYVFEVRRLSNTSNPNVICQLRQKSGAQSQEDLKAFEKQTNCR